MRCVARRSKGGMGLKLMKFHAILHLIEDIILYGVPMEFDSGSNESHHKDTKYAAKLTQRKEATFNAQTAKRLVEFLCIDLAMEEIDTGRCSWDYFFGAVEAVMKDRVETVRNAADIDSKARTIQIWTIRFLIRKRRMLIQPIQRRIPRKKNCS